MGLCTAFLHPRQRLGACILAENDPVNCLHPCQTMRSVAFRVRAREGQMPQRAPVRALPPAPTRPPARPQGFLLSWMASALGVCAALLTGARTTFSHKAGVVPPSAFTGFREEILARRGVKEGHPHGPIRVSLTSLELGLQRPRTRCRRACPVAVVLRVCGSFSCVCAAFLGGGRGGCDPGPAGLVTLSPCRRALSRRHGSRLGAIGVCSSLRSHAVLELLSRSDGLSVSSGNIVCAGRVRRARNGA